MKTWQRSLLIVSGLLFVGTAVAYAQLPEPKVHEFPYLGNRGAVWIVAQLHILFAAFILGAPIFVVVSEILGWKNQDTRYERLAKEVTKVTVILYSMTALMNTPSKFAEVGMDLKTFIETTSTLWDKMNNYSWWPLNIHRTVGNVVFGGFITGLIGAYMYLAAKTDEERAFYDWFGFVGNLIGVGALLALPFAGYLLAYELCDYDASICPYMMADQLSMFFEMQGAMVGLIFLASNYYIWLSMKRIEGLEQIRMRTTTLVLMASIPVVFMLIWTKFPIPDKFALILPACWVALFLIAGRCFKWTVGAQTLVKVAFLMVIIGNAIWMTPHAFVATQALAPDDGSLSLPHGELSLGFVTISWGDLALMPAKNAAAFTLVFVTIVNYIL